MVLATISGLVLSSLLFYWFITKWFSKTVNKKKIPPSPWKLPILGNLHQLGSLPHQSLHSLAQKHGPVMLLHFGSLPTVVVSSPDAAQEIMKTHDLIFADRPKASITQRLLYDTKDVAFAPYGEYWRQLKSICVLQLLSNKRVQSFHSIREEEMTLLIDKIKKDLTTNSFSVVNLSDSLKELTNDVVCRSAFGKKYSEGESGKKILGLLSEFVELLGKFNIADYVPWLSWVSQVNGINTKADKVAKQLDDFLEGVIQERVSNPKDAKHGDNFVDILLDIYKNNNTTGVSIDRDSIKAILLDVFSAGTDTTFTVIEWAMAELLRYPTIMGKLKLEIRQVIQDKHDITDHELERMHFLKAVIKETLRCHTPIPLLVPRIASKDVIIKGYDISAGTMAVINAWAIGRDPAYWDEPEKFEPDRFMKSSIDFRGFDFEFIPFGAGRRGCPGISFAVATNEFVLANLVHKFDWVLPDGEADLDMTELPGISIHRAFPLCAVATIGSNCW